MSDKAELTVVGQDPPADLVAMTNDALRVELAKQLRWNAEGMLRLAWTVRLLEERGDDLSGLRLPLLDHLRRIAYGQVLPELVVRFASNSQLLRKVSLLSLPEQQRLVVGGTVELVVRRQSETGVTHDHVMADPAKMTQDQVFQAFGPDRVRTRAEQILYLEDRSTKPARVVPPRGRVRPDPARGGLVVNRSFVTQAEILDALASLRRHDEPEGAAASEEGRQLLVALSEKEHIALKVRAAQQDTTMTELVRKALRAAGLI